MRTRGLELTVSVGHVHMWTNLTESVYSLGVNFGGGAPTILNDDLTAVPAEACGCHRRCPAVLTAEGGRTPLLPSPVRRAREADRQARCSGDTPT